MPDDSGQGDKPEYKVYRSRPGRSRSEPDTSGLEALRNRNRPDAPKEPREHRQIGWGKVAKWAAVAVGAWLLLSFVVFLVSAQTQTGVSGTAEDALTGGGNSLLTGSNILVLGSDSRGGDSIDESQSGPGRADSILVMRASFGSVRKLSIPRDSMAQIPGHDTQKINAAYALGGTSLMIKTVEGFLGNDLKINHVVEVDFQDFPELIDAVGGVTVDNKSKICAPPFDNFWKGFNLPKGTQKLDGPTALGFARVRKNPCAPAENDLDRAARQQQVVSGLRGALLRPATFFRLPMISWQAPKAIKSDMKGPGLMGMFTDLITGNSDETNVLKPDSFNADGTLGYSDGTKADAVRKLEGD